MSPDRAFSALAFPALPSEHQQALDARARASGHAAGYAAGLREAEAGLARRVAELETEHESALRHARARLDRAVEVLAAAAAALDERMLPVLAEANQTLAENAMDLAEAILGVELANPARSSVAAMTRALSGADAALVGTVRLNPMDLAVLDEETTSSAGVVLAPDPTLARGDAIADLPVGYLDARISTATARARAAIMGRP